MRRKNTDSSQIQSKTKQSKNKSDFVYCNQRKCIHTECLRHNVNTPWNVMIYRDKFEPDKEWNCKDIILER